MLSEGIWNFGHPARLGRSRDVIFLFFGIVRREAFALRRGFGEGRKEGREGSSWHPAARGNGSEFGRGLSPRSPALLPALSAAFHACIAKDDLQKRSARRTQQGAPSEPDRLSWHTAADGRRPMLRAMCRTSLQVILCYAGMEGSRAREREAEAEAEACQLPLPSSPRLEPGHSYSFLLPSLLLLPHTYSICFRFQESPPRML